MLAILSVAGLAYALVVFVSALRVIRGVPLVASLEPKEPVAWPRVSVVVPACNEADTLEAAMRSRLAEGYPNVEYLLVDDRSTDGTGDIVDRLAAEDARIVALHVEDLPAGWLGKVNAMQHGVEHANGDWILFSDADIHHEPGMLARIVAHCEETGIDHVSVLPSIWSSTFWLDVMLSSVVRIMTSASRAWKIPDPTSRVSFGGGIFNLVRRSALERMGGLSPLKLEVIDDIGLGQLLKHSGARQAIFNARGQVSLYWYRSVGEAVRGMEKNSFAALGRFNVVQFVVILGLFAVVELAPFVALAAGAGPWRLLGGIASLLLLNAQWTSCRWLGRPVLATLLAPIGSMLLLFGAARSMFVTLARGGVEWRGTRYSLEALRAGMRFTLE